MSHLLDDDNIEEFRGGTLQLNTSNATLGEQRNSSRERTSRYTGSRGATDSTGLHSDDNESAILIGVDVISPITSTSSASDKIDLPHNEIVPVYHIPFAFENAKNYFSHRNGLVEAAIDECTSTLLFPNQDGQVIGSWLLTEISLWDNEKERLVILTDRVLISIKYDFIALRQLEFRKVRLEHMDTVVIGDLVYPPSSLVPRLNGLATGVSSVVRDCIVDRFTPSTAGAQSGHTSADQCGPKGIFGPIDLKKFESRDRNMRGVRAMWNRGQPLSFVKKWNPFDNDIPMNTFTSHPLFYHKDTPEDANKSLYDVDHFGRCLTSTVESAGREPLCVLQHSPIVLPNYIGLTSLVHNKNSLGFFKVRGKFSF